MKQTRKLLMLCLGASLGILNSQAALLNTIVTSGWDGDDVGTVDSYTVSVVASGNDLVYSWTATGDLDNYGNSDDTLSFDITLSAYTASSYDAGTNAVTLGTAFDLAGVANQHFGPEGDIDVNQSFSLRVSNLVFTQGGGGSAFALFDGFSGLSRFGASTLDESFFLGTTEATEINIPAGDTTIDFSGETYYDLTLSMFGDNNNRFRSLGFSVSIIPEPSSAGLLLLGGIGLLSRRHRVK